MQRRRVEAALAVLITAAVVLAGGAAIYFVSTMSVHGDPAAVPSRSGGPPPERYSAAVEQARHLARALVVEENLPGLSLAVANGEGIAWAEAFGWADVERREAVTPLTKFRIGSVSRPLTAAGVGLLHDRGLLDLDAPVQRYVPAYPAKPWAVSTRQLMGDVAGVHHLRDNGTEIMPGRHCTGVGEALGLFAGDPLRFRPGTQYRYSIYGWILVSAVVEATAGRPFSGFMKEDVFQPLGMASTLPAEALGVSDLAWFYFPRTAGRPTLGLQDAPSADYSCWAGAGAFVSTPSDLARFGAAMLKPGLLKAQTIADLQTPLRLESGSSTGYALGWKVESAQVGGIPTRLLSSRGSPMGGTVSLLVFPDLGLVIAAASNVSYATGVAPFGLKLADAFSRPPGAPVH